MVAGDIKLCTSEFQLKDKKIFLLASFEMKKENHQLDTAMIAEASLSVDHPIVVKVGKNVYPIGTREEFLYRRLAIQAARQRIQKGSRYCRGGKGYKKKLGALERFRDKEKNYIGTKLHLYSKRLIEICIKHRAGALLLTNQAEKEESAKEDEFLLRNWSYFELKQKIAYKAERAGIMVIEE
jgi:IS605 OrfB family transposase